METNLESKKGEGNKTFNQPETNKAGKMKTTIEHF